MTTLNGLGITISQIEKYISNVFDAEFSASKVRIETTHIIMIYVTGKLDGKDEEFSLSPHEILNPVIGDE